jgi:hypothetical protein
MTTLTDRDVVEKWSHIAMKLFPPQMDISVACVNGSWSVCARWKAPDSGVDPLARGVRGVDLHFEFQYPETGDQRLVKATAIRVFNIRSPVPDLRSTVSSPRRAASSPASPQ